VVGEMIQSCTCLPHVSKVIIVFATPRILWILFVYLIVIFICMVFVFWWFKHKCRFFRFYYVSPSNEGRHIVLVWFFLPLLLRSRSHEGHYGMRHTALWSCTHKPNIIDLSGKTKKLWSGQASLRSLVYSKFFPKKKEII
jgi:hypothetical protein